MTKFKKSAVELLYKYARGCCYHECSHVKDTSPVDLEESLSKIFPNATPMIISIAESYGLDEINDEVVHAYFFTYHNRMHEINKNPMHKVYYGKVVKKLSEEDFLVFLEGLGKKNVRNIYGFKIKEGDEVITHCDYIVTNKVPKYIRELYYEKDIRAWESVIRKR